MISFDFFKYRKEKNYELELFDHLQFYNKAACLLGAMLVLAGIILDYYYYNEQLKLFIFLRILTAGFIIIFGYLFELSKSYRNKKIFSYLWMYAPQIMICYMIYLTNAEQSSYFFGLTLALVGAAFLLPLSVLESALLGLSTIIFYFVACFYNSTGIQNYNNFYGNSIYLLFYSAIAFSISIYSELRRWQSFLLKKKLALNNDMLFKSNRNLTEIKGHMIQQEKMSALGTLSAGLLHELNNPVSYSMMAISMAEMEPDVANNAQLKETLADAKEGMKRVADIVTDLKTFAYQKPGDDNKRVFLFENALRSALRLSSFELKDIALPQDLPIDTHVLGDEPALIGVLINLATNAALALRKSEHEKPFINIKAWHGVNAEGLPRLFVTVRDNGTGIKPENIDKIFEPFFTTRDVGQGLGLGLAVSYAIIQRHGSELKVTSEEGAWTEFSFDLPTNGNAQS